MTLSERLRSTLAGLVAIDSTSSLTNLPVLDFLEARLQGAGFHCRRLPFRDDAGVEKANLVATRGEGPAGLALVGHTDCVPFDPAWKEALLLEERDGRLYGRGACDTKGFVACALVAAERSAPSSRPLALVFTADEEVGCLGAKKLVGQGAVKARYAIVGEPTRLIPVRANKGYCLAEVEVLGKEGHSAYPDAGASAIFRAARYLNKLETFARGELRDEVDPAFDPPFTTVNVGVVSGGKAKNIVPGSCRFVVEWRPIPRQPIERVLHELQRIGAELATAEPGFEARLRPLQLDRGVETLPSSAVVQFLAERTGKPPSTVSYGTEAPQLTQLGAEAVVFGPGDIGQAHRTGEYVPLDELVRCEELLEEAIAHFTRA
ncbi:MAG: acetylornithine deacetylase [Myxococcaceae bacterium]